MLAGCPARAPASLPVAVLLTLVVVSCGGPSATQHARHRRPAVRRPWGGAPVTHGAPARIPPAEPVAMSATPRALLAVCERNSLSYFASGRSGADSDSSVVAHASCSSSSLRLKTLTRQVMSSGSAGAAGPEGSRRFFGATAQLCAHALLSESPGEVTSTPLRRARGWSIAGTGRKFRRHESAARLNQTASSCIVRRSVHYRSRSTRHSSRSRTPRGGGFSNAWAAAPRR
jgi:hypothetical protein